MQGNQLVEKLSVLREIHISINCRAGSWETSAQGILRVTALCKTLPMPASPVATVPFFGEAFLTVLIHSDTERLHQSRSVMLHHVHCTQEYSNFCTGRAVVIVQGRVTWARESPGSCCHSSSFVSIVSHLQTPVSCPLCMLVLAGCCKPP